MTSTSTSTLSSTIDYSLGSNGTERVNERMLVNQRFAENVAPTFIDYILLSDKPFSKNNKLYLHVAHPRTHNERDIRFYNDKEKQKLYNKTSSPSLMIGLKEARGFQDGSIYVILNNNPKDEPFLDESPARFATDTGWYIASEDKQKAKEINWPNHIKFKELRWREVYSEENHGLRSASALLKLLETKEEITLSSS